MKANGGNASEWGAVSLKKTEKSSIRALKVKAGGKDFTI